MEPRPAVPRHEAIERGEHSVHEWRVTQLIRLGIPGPLDLTGHSQVRS